MRDTLLLEGNRDAVVRKGIHVGGLDLKAKKSEARVVERRGAEKINV